MHDYTARIIHEDRMAQFVREGDASRLAAAARDGHARQTGMARMRRVLHLMLTRRIHAFPLRRALGPARVSDAAATPTAE